MKLVKQKHKYGCAIACFAMLHNIDYYKSLKIFYPHRKKRDKINGISVLKFFKKLKYFNYNVNIFFETIISEIKCNSFLILKYHDNSQHVVFWDAGSRNIFDPAKGILNEEDLEFYQKNLYMYITIQD